MCFYTGDVLYAFSDGGRYEDGAVSYGCAIYRWIAETKDLQQTESNLFHELGGVASDDGSVYTRL